jgi:hypothetical protein
MNSQVSDRGIGDELDRSLAQFFFEVGYSACFADAMVANNRKPPFKLTDALVERAWRIAGEAYEEPAEFDAKLAMTNAAPELYEALEVARGILETLAEDNMSPDLADAQEQIDAALIKAGRDQ